MILVLKNNLSESDIAFVVKQVGERGFTAQLIYDQPSVVALVLGDTRSLATHVFSQIRGVEKVVKIHPPHPLVASKKRKSIQLGNGAIIGGGKPVVIGGPCSVESEDLLIQIARDVKASGAKLLRGGAFKPRTSPYDFRGLGKLGFEYLSYARRETGLPVVSEVMSAEQVELAESYVDVLQIGARNMYNYELLSEVGKSKLPVLLKRGMSATLSDLLQAAEYVMLAGNENVILCERGIRTFETYTRNTLDLSAVAALKIMTDLPVLVDPSHATGRRDLIRPMSRAAIAAGADGLIIEVHPEPSQAMSDGAQAITPLELGQIVSDVDKISAIFADGGEIQSKALVASAAASGAVLS